MAKRLTRLDRAIQNIDEQIKALQLARQHLVAQQRPEQRPRPLTTPKRPVEHVG